MKFNVLKCIFKSVQTTQRPVFDQFASAHHLNNPKKANLKSVAAEISLEIINFLVRLCCLQKVTGHAVSDARPPLTSFARNSLTVPGHWRGRAVGWRDTRTLVPTHKYSPAVSFWVGLHVGGCAFIPCCGRVF